MKKDSTAYAATRVQWDKSDCSIRALSVAAGCSYEHASGIFSAAGRRLKKGTPIETSKQVYEQWLHMTPMPEAENCRLEVFLTIYTRGKYILHRRGHAFAVVNGIVHDWEATKTGDRSVIQQAWKVTEETLVKIEKTRALFE